MRLKSTIYESTLSTADAVPLPQWGRQISSGYAAILADGIPLSSAFPSRGRRFLLSGEAATFIPKETLIESLFDFTLVFSCNARNNPTRIASYLRRIMTKRCMKIHVKSNSAI